MSRDLKEHAEQAHGYSLRPDQARIKTSVEKSLITRKINRISHLITL